MPVSVSEHYRKLTPEQVGVFAEVYADAWQDPSLPERQYEACVKDELEAYRNGEPSLPFDALKSLLKQIPDMPETKLLDVGASSGYYSEVLKTIGFPCKYTALDFSTYFKDLAAQLFPDIEFKIGSATELPFENDSFDIVLSGAVLMHLQNYQKAIQEAARVSRRYVVFHRTPVYMDETPTEFFVKTAYGTPCIEAHFNEIQLLQLFERNGLRLRGTKNVFKDGNFGHVSYLLQKAELQHHPV